MNSGIRYRKDTPSRVTALSTALVLCTTGILPSQTLFTHDPAGNRASQGAGLAALPTIAIPPSDQVAKLGETARFAVVAGGPGPFTYEWFKGAVAMVGATSDTLQITSLGAGDFASGPTGTPRYSVRVTNATGDVTSTAVGIYQDSIGAGLPDWWRQQYFSTATNDLWDLSQGNAIIASTAQGAGDLRNMIGGSFSSAEAGIAIYSDAQSAGYVHAVEFQRPTTIQLTGYRLVIGDDAVSGSRGISEFRLYYFNTSTNSYQLLDTYAPASHPYGSATSVLNILDVTRNVTPVLASKYRAEFVQSANPPYGGPRVIELDAISSAGPPVDPQADADGDGVTNQQEFADGTQPNNASSHLGRLSLIGPAGLVNALPLQTTYAAGTAVSATAGSVGELQFGGWTGSYRSQDASLGFNFRGGGDVILKSLYGSMPVRTTAASPSFTHSNNSQAAVNGFATAPDGQWIAFGNFDRVNGQQRPFVARFFPDGSLDAGFAPAPNAHVTGAVIQPDGKIVIAGSFTVVAGQPRPGVARFNADGTLDSSFAPVDQGLNVTQAMALEVQRDGKVLLGGAIWDGSAWNAFLRLNQDGSVDPSFVVTLNALPTTITQQADGKILLGGGFSLVNGTAAPKLVRLNLDGTLDPSFSQSVTLGVASPPSAVSVQPDGKILAGGSVQVRLNGSDVLVPVARFHADGTLDTAFTQKVFGYAANLVFNDMALQDDGRIVGVGSFALTSPSLVNAMRLNPDGSLDPDCFAISRANAAVNAVAVQTDGGLLLGGGFSGVDVASGSGNNHIYQFTSGRKGWFAAEAEAVALGGHLVSIGSQMEQDFLTRTLLPVAGRSGTPAWLGFTDFGAEGLFAWTSGEPVNFTNWNSGEPNNYNGIEDGSVFNYFPASPATWVDSPDAGAGVSGAATDGPYYGVIEIDPALPANPNDNWIAGRDLISNEKAGSVQELANPNAAVPQWSYGSRATLTSATQELTLFIPGEHSNGVLEGWHRPLNTIVDVNTSTAGVSQPHGFIHPGEIRLHPPAAGFTVVRWTAPVAGNYSVNAFWQDSDWSAGDGASAHIVKNGTEIIFNFGFANGNGAFAAHTLALQPGDVLDFALGINGNDGADSTRFNAIITKIQNAATDVWLGGRDLAANEKPDGNPNESINPNPTVPQWSYGQRNIVATSGLDLFSGAPSHYNSFAGGGPDDAFEGWVSGSGLGVNTGTVPLTYNYGFGPNISFNPDEMMVFPGGSGGPYPVVRWTAPAAGRYDLLAVWQDSDFHGGNGITAHIVVNGGQVYGQDIDNVHGSSTVQSLNLKAGDLVDFLIGTRGDYSFDVTKFNVAIVKPASSTAPSTPSGTLSLAATRAEVAANATINWADAGANNADIPGNPFAITSSSGTSYLVRKATTGTFKRLNQGAGWAGNFAPGDPLVIHAYSDGPVIIEAANTDGVFSAAGLQIQPNQEVPFVATIRAYDVNGVLIGNFTVNGNSNAIADNSAIFVGVKSTVENIHSISVDTDTSNFGGDFAINNVSIQSTAQATGNELSNGRLSFARLTTTNHLIPGALTASPAGPVFAANASTTLSLSPDVPGEPVIFATLESSADGVNFESFGYGSSNGAGTWNFPVAALPPGANYFRAVAVNSNQEQARSHAVGPLVTPPVVTSPLAAQGLAGEPFSYAATATGRLSAFTTGSLPAWATGSYDANSGVLTISGTPTTTGISTISLQPANAAGSTPATLTLTVLNQFANWQTANFTASEMLDPAISGPLGDATGAGIENLIKYALGIPPKLPGTAGLPFGTVQPYGAFRYLTLVYTRDMAVQDLSLAVEVSGNVILWNSGPAHTTEVSRVSNPNHTETITVRDNVATTAGQNRFMRLKVVQ